MFSRKSYSVSRVIDPSRFMANIFMLSKFDKAESTIKPWAVAQLFADGKFVYHKNFGSFFEQRSALKRFCDFSNQSYE